MTQPAHVRIYQPAKNAMQSGKAEKLWRLEYAPLAAGTPEPVMGWSSMPDTRAELKLEFLSAEDAMVYAQNKGLTYTVIEPKEAAPKPKAYADNYACNRRSAFDPESCPRYMEGQ